MFLPERLNDTRIGFRVAQVSVKSLWYSSVAALGLAESWRGAGRHAVENTFGLRQSIPNCRALCGDKVPLANFRRNSRMIFP